MSHAPAAPAVEDKKEDYLAAGPVAHPVLHVPPERDRQFARQRHNADAPIRVPTCTFMAEPA